ncbi:efflux transporter outer membrane subunit [Phenylobacterium sp.]|uniref:efflux transporter outer membrane subunit n=1 Tax=Phenylobacterium sp. TaxID=1871053 RepID=UPI00289FE4EA|nr:efflux transporter outer membrane subunit [Phenylobacterium sp.]
MSLSINPRRHALLGASLAVLLSACTTVGPDFQSPGAPAAQGYAMAGDAAPAIARLDPDTAASGPWWTALGSSQLDQVIRQAIADSPTLDEADATLRQARSALAQARGEAGPQADLNAGFHRERANLQAFGFTGFGDMQLENPTFSLYSVGGGIGYDLDLFGGERRRLEGASARAEAQARRADAAYLSLTANVALQAVTIATLQAQIEATEQMIAADEANVELVRKANALGGSTSTARVAAQSQLEQDLTLLPPLRAQLAAARHALAVLVGHAPAEWTAPDFRLADLGLAGPAPIALPSQLVRRRPDILAAEADLHAATADIGVATADLYPKIRLTASIAQGSLKPADLFSYDASGWDVGAGLTAPLFDGGALKARRQQAREAAAAASARYRQTVLTAFAQVADALSALSADEESLAAHSRSLAQADENLRLAKVAYERGGGAFLEVLDAQRRVNESQSSLARANGQRLADAVRLFAAAGADWRTASDGSSD